MAGALLARGSLGLPESKPTAAVDIDTPPKEALPLPPMELPGTGQNLGVVGQGIGLLAQVTVVPPVLEQRHGHVDKAEIARESKPHIVVVSLPVGGVDPVFAADSRS